MQDPTKTGSPKYQQPEIVDSFDELEVLGDAPGIAVGGAGSQILPNEV